jgi:5-methylcytosine-specific restriction endonuclease McrA
MIANGDTINMKFKLEQYHRNIPSDELIKDLMKASETLKKETVTIDEYNETGKFHSTTLARRFGSWFKALEKAGLKRTRTLGVTDEEYFENLEEVWVKLGRQPKYSDMQKPTSKYVAGAYEHRFGTWRKALEIFIKFINQEKTRKIISPTPLEKHRTKHKTKRSISWRLRFIVMKKDGFKCKTCGESPATNRTVVLHVDHIKPWSKGGETVLENLQTLCSKCNIGKSNLNN